LYPIHSEVSLTRKSRDGGFDAFGRYFIGPQDDKIPFEFFIEAKCYNPGSGEGTARNSVGTKEVSRLISRIRNRQMGFLVTTSVVHKQAYEEVRKDGHPIVFLSGKDIVDIIRRKANIQSAKDLNDFLLSSFPLS
jgi:hypothetical protein